MLICFGGNVVIIRIKCLFHSVEASDQELFCAGLSRSSGRWKLSKRDVSSFLWIRTTRFSFYYVSLSGKWGESPSPRKRLCPKLCVFFTQLGNWSRISDCRRFHLSKWQMVIIATWVRQKESVYNGRRFEYIVRLMAHRRHRLSQTSFWLRSPSPSSRGCP